MQIIDPTTERGQHIAQKLEKEQIIWLITVNENGEPQPSPVWFLWDSKTFLVYSRPNKPKVRNIAVHPTVALHLNSDFAGHDIIIFKGTAVSDPTIPPADQHEAYLNKYNVGIASINMTPESFANAFSNPIRITPTKLR